MIHPILHEANTKTPRGPRANFTGSRTQPSRDIASIVSEFDLAVFDLFRKKRTKADALLKVVERIRADSRTTAMLQRIVACNLGEDVPESMPLKSNRHVDTARTVLFQGLFSAFSISTFLNAFATTAQRDDSLILAALLQDIGFLAMAKRQPGTPAEIELRNPAAYRSHPLWGAAIAGGLTRCTSELPELIAQHHERQNGTGFPRGCRTRQLSWGSRLLQVVACFSERFAVHRSADRPVAVSIHSTADELIHLTVSGHFDRGLVREFLEFTRSPEFHAAEEAVAAPAKVNLTSPMLPQVSERRLLEESDETRREAPQPKFLRHRRGSVDLTTWVQSSTDLEGR